MAKQIGELLKINTSITNLNLSYNDFNTECIKVIGQGLIENTTLISLDLSECELTSECIEELKEPLRANKTLKNLSLTENIFYQDGLSPIGDILCTNTGLEILNISNNYDINYWDCDGPDCGCEKIAKGLYTNKTLRSLNLKRTCLDLACCNSLAPALMNNTTLEKLNYTNDKITESMVIGLSKNKSIRDLTIRANMTFIWQKYYADFIPLLLKNNTTIQKLQISNIKPLSWKDSLRYKNVCNEIIKALEFNNTLQELDIKDNRFGFKNGTCLAEIMSNNKSLRTIKMDANDFTDTDTEQINSYLRRNVYLQDYSKQALTVHLGFGKTTPFYIKQLLIFSDKLDKTENLRYSDILLKRYTQLL